LQFILTPEDVESPSVDRAFFLKPDVGFVRVASFDNDTGQQIKAAIEKLGGSKLKGLVLDLRNNPGGVLPAALETAGLFLKPGQRILTIKGRAKKDDEAHVKADATPYSFPMAVLVNGKSASASEIVAGGLQDHDRATIIGEPSYGKGLVQSVYPLSNGTGLALTTAFYYTPSGRSIQKHLSGALDEATAADRADNTKVYHTDSGRLVKGGGGIQPDQIVYPEGVSQLRAVLESTGAFPTFATAYIRQHPDLKSDFDAPSAVLDEFRVLLSQNNIQPSVGEWSKESDWIRNRLTQEILNQAFGVAKGDEVEAKIDPQVQAALKAIGAL
jgi:carboxyl-terminal processing protease